MTPVMAIVFDLDQTLFDRQLAWDRWIASIDISQRDRMELRVLDCNGLGNRDVFFATFESMTGRPIDQIRFAVSLSQFIEPDPALILMLKRLQEHYKLAILTNGGDMTQNFKLQELTVDQVISSDRIFVSSQIGFAKPDRRAFDFVADALGLRAEECFYFGDQLESDVMAARAAGWRAGHVSGPEDLRHRLDPFVETFVC